MEKQAVLLTLPQITHEARRERRKRLKQKYGFKFQLETHKMDHRKSEARIGWMDWLEDIAALTQAKKTNKQKKPSGNWTNTLRCIHFLRFLLHRVCLRPVYKAKDSLSYSALDRVRSTFIVIVFVYMQDTAKPPASQWGRVRLIGGDSPLLIFDWSLVRGWGTQWGLWSPCGLQKQGHRHYFHLQSSMFDCHVKLFVAYASSSFLHAQNTHIRSGSYLWKYTLNLLLLVSEGTNWSLHLGLFTLRTLK